MTYKTTIELCGIELDVEIEFEADLVDSGIGRYEFWGHRSCDKQHAWEISDVISMIPLTDIRETVLSYITPADFRNRKSFLKALRRTVRSVENALNKANPADYADEDDMIDACDKSF
jgi:hypothetical protein